MFACKFLARLLDFIAPAKKGASSAQSLLPCPRMPNIAAVGPLSRFSLSLFWPHPFFLETFLFPLSLSSASHPFYIPRPRIAIDIVPSSLRSILCSSPRPCIGFPIFSCSSNIRSLRIAIPVVRYLRPFNCFFLFLSSCHLYFSFCFLFSSFVSYFYSFLTCCLSLSRR